VLKWSAPGPECALPLDYEIARFDLDCLTHYCKACRTCNIIGRVRDPDTTFTDPTPPSNVGYLVRVTSGTWNESGGSCVDLDRMFMAGCP